MKKIVLFTITAITLFTIASCGIGLAPAWKTQGSTSIVLTLGNPEGDNAAGRAIVGGGGYLYIKPGTVPEGAKSWYGPFFVPENGSFEFKELPAGSYSYIALLYTAKPIENLDYEITDGGTVINRKMIDVFEMSGPAFLEEIQETEPETNPRAQAFASALRGQASRAILYDQTIVENKKNVLGAILEPITPMSRAINSVPYTFSLMGDGALEKTFIRLEVLSSALTTITPGVPHELSITLTPTPATSTIRDIRLFQNDGKRVPATITQDTTAPNSKIIKAKWDLPASAENYYFYIYVDSDSNYIGATFEYNEIVVEPEPTTGYTITVTGLNQTAVGEDLTGGSVFIALTDTSTQLTDGTTFTALGFSENTFIDNNGVITLNLFTLPNETTLEDLTEDNLTNPWAPDPTKDYYVFLSVDKGENVYILISKDSTINNTNLLSTIQYPASKNIMVDTEDAKDLLNLYTPIEASGYFDPAPYDVQYASIRFATSSDPFTWEDDATNSIVGTGNADLATSSWSGTVIPGTYSNLWIIVTYIDSTFTEYTLIGDDPLVNETVVSGTPFSPDIYLNDFHEVIQ